MPGARDTRPPAGQAELDAAVDALSGRTIVALTGAGFSTDSGLPDYRGPEAKPRNPMTYDQFVGSPDYRRHYWARNHLGWHHMHATEPNEGHYALARLEAAGIVLGVITQNVDRLHERAGSRRVVELHGNYNVVRCLSCGWTCSRAELDARLSALNPGFLDRVTELGDIEVAPDADVVLEATSDFVVADCPVCGGILKPHVVFYGENVPAQRKQYAMEQLAASQALLVVGSSLMVFSGLRFVHAAQQQGSLVAAINLGVTRADALLDCKLAMPCAEALQALVAALSAG